MDENYNNELYEDFDLDVEREKVGMYLEGMRIGYEQGCDRSLQEYLDRKERRTSGVKGWIGALIGMAVSVGINVLRERKKK